jgi:hypothetical protein
VNVFDLNLTGAKIPDSVGGGDRFRFVAQVVKYNPTQCLLSLRRFPPESGKSTFASLAYNLDTPPSAPPDSIEHSVALARAAHLNGRSPARARPFLVHLPDRLPGRSS